MSTRFSAGPDIKQENEAYRDPDKHLVASCGPPPLLGLCPYKREPGGPTKPPVPLCQEEMGKVKQHVDGRSQAARVKVRKTLGALKNL